MCTVRNVRFGISAIQFCIGGVGQSVLRGISGTPRYYTTAVWWLNPCEALGKTFVDQVVEANYGVNCDREAEAQVGLTRCPHTRSDRAVRY